MWSLTLFFLLVCGSLEKKKKKFLTGSHEILSDNLDYNNNILDLVISVRQTEIADYLNIFCSTYTGCAGYVEEPSPSKNISIEIRLTEGI